MSTTELGGKVIMTESERQLLAECGKEIVELYGSRNDMVVGITAALLDIHRVLIQAGHQSKQDVIDRLTVQKNAILGHSPKQLGALLLQSLIDTLADDTLDAAKLLREPAAGSA